MRSVRTVRNSIVEQHSRCSIFLFLNPLFSHRSHRSLTCARQADRVAWKQESLIDIPRTNAQTRSAHSAPGDHVSGLNAASHTRHSCNRSLGSPRCRCGADAAATRSVGHRTLGPGRAFFVRFEARARYRATDPFGRKHRPNSNERRRRSSSGAHPSHS